MWLLFACTPDPVGHVSPETPTAPVPECAPATADIDLADAVAGHREDHVVYRPDWAPERDVLLNVWYPTDDVTGDPVRYLDFVPDRDSLGNAGFAPPAEGCPLPLAVYSHGDRAWGGSGTDVARQLVRNGWVVVAPDHATNTFADNEEPHPVGFDLTRVADVQAAIDHLADLPSDDPLAGWVDLDRVLVVGHSYGGQTAWLLSGLAFDSAGIEERCATNPLGCTDAERHAYTHPVDDPRVRAVVSLDGEVQADSVSAEGWRERRTPALYLSQVGENATNAYARAEGEGVVWVQVTGACHASFQSAPLPCDGLSREEGLRLTSQWVAAFGAARVTGATGFEDLLSGAVSTSDLAIVTP